MSLDKEYQQLARKFLDLWQERMATVLQDGEFLRLLLKMVQGDSFSATGGTAGVGGVFTYGADRTQAGSAAYAPDPRDAALARIEERLRSIERGMEKSARKHSRRTGRAVAKIVAKPKTHARGRGRSKAKAR